jgi:hypothetical protein
MFVSCDKLTVQMNAASRGAHTRPEWPNHNENKEQSLWLTPVYHPNAKQNECESITQQFSHSRCSEQRQQSNARYKPEATSADRSSDVRAIVRARYGVPRTNAFNILEIRDC